MAAWVPEPGLEKKLSHAISWNLTTIIQTSSYKHFWLEEIEYEPNLTGLSVNQVDFPSKFGSISFKIWNYFFQKLAVFPSKFGNISFKSWCYFVQKLAVFPSKVGIISFFSMK
jgi:hypothetical protein